MSFLSGGSLGSSFELELRKGFADYQKQQQVQQMPSEAPQDTQNSAFPYMTHLQMQQQPVPQSTSQTPGFFPFGQNIPFSTFFTVNHEQLILRNSKAILVITAHDSRPVITRTHLLSSAPTTPATPNSNMTPMTPSPISPLPQTTTPLFTQKTPSGPVRPSMQLLNDVSTEIFHTLTCWIWKLFVDQKQKLERCYTAQKQLMSAPKQDVFTQLLTEERQSKEAIEAEMKLLNQLFEQVILEPQELLKYFTLKHDLELQHKQLDLLLGELQNLVQPNSTTAYVSVIPSNFHRLVANRLISLMNDPFLEWKAMYSTLQMDRSINLLCYYSTFPLNSVEFPRIDRKSVDFIDDQSIFRVENIVFHSKNGLIINEIHRFPYRRTFPITFPWKSIYRHFVPTFCSLASLVIIKQPFPLVISKAKQLGEDQFQVQLLTSSGVSVQQVSQVKASMLTDVASSKGATKMLESDTSVLDANRTAKFPLKFMSGTKKAPAQVRFGMQLQLAGYPSPITVESNSSAPLVVITNECQWEGSAGTLLKREAFAHGQVNSLLYNETYVLSLK